MIWEMGLAVVGDDVTSGVGGVGGVGEFVVGVDVGDSVVGA